MTSACGTCMLEPMQALALRSVLSQSPILETLSASNQLLLLAVNCFLINLVVTRKGVDDMLTWPCAVGW